MRKRIGECLIQAGLLTEENLQAALAEHKRTGERLGAVLIRMGFASEKEITKALAHQLGFPFVSLADEPPDPSAMVLIPKDIALKRVCVAVRLERNVLTVAMSDPLLFSLVRDLEFQTGYRIRQVVTTRSEILDALAGGYPDKALVQTAGRDASPAVAQRTWTPERQEAPPKTARRADEAIFEGPKVEEVKPEAGPIIELVDSVVKSAVAARASDIHIEPAEQNVLVRHRLDGLLKPVLELPAWAHDGLVARIKVMGGMDIAEKRLPQDGRIRIKTDDGRNVDFRVSSLRTLFGEKMVLRVLDSRKGPPPLEELGLSAGGMDDLHYFLRHQHGMILVVGPTGSGKTTTLSSALDFVKSPKTNIITIEDPIEYQIAGINQTQINEKAKLTFASALRSILRQDPDIILVGEIRDHETAKIALQAAQTGHLVLSTLHTDDAPSVVTRLMDMGMEPYIIASALIGVVAQRLVRRLCVHCRRVYMPSAETLQALNIPEDEATQFPFYRAVGCDRCSHTGYKGRIAIYEVMRVSDRVRRLISQRAGEDPVRDAALEAGMVTLGEDGLGKVKSGVTTPEELLRVVTEVREMRTFCPGCRESVGLDFVACPACGRRLSGGCRQCGRSLQAHWNYCPYCTTSTGTTPAARPAEEPRPTEMALPRISEFRKS